jgi:uncharacterized protein
MADYENPAYRTPSSTVDQGIDQGLRAHMISVYQYMMLGVAVTGLAAYFVGTNPALFHMVYGTPLRWVVMFAPLAIVWFAFGNVNSMSAGRAQTWFWIFSALMGVSLGYIFQIYVAADIVRVFFVTSISFGALSLYGYTTKRDLSAYHSFLFMGLVGVAGAILINIFLASSALNFAISVIGVLVFAGLTAYDTQHTKEIYFAGDDSDTAGKKAILAALNLYLDFINMFMFLLRLMGSSRN